MADQTTSNINGDVFPHDQITAAVVDANVKVVADAPAMSLAAIYETLASGTALTFANAITAQHQATTSAQTATTAGTAQIYAVPTAEAAAATNQINASALASLMAQLSAVSKGGRSNSALFGPPETVESTLPISGFNLIQDPDVAGSEILTILDATDNVQQQLKGLIVSFDSRPDEPLLRIVYRPLRSDLA